MFATLFAAYAVLARATDGGPRGVQLFSQASVAIETACLLASSYTCGLMSLAVKSRRHLGTYFGALVTFALGLAFLALELREFADMIARGAGPQRSAFLSAFFTLVGCHGLHVTAGLIWLAVMMVQVALTTAFLRMGRSSRFFVRRTSATRHSSSAGLSTFDRALKSSVTPSRASPCRPALMCGASSNPAST